MDEKDTLLEKRSEWLDSMNPSQGFERFFDYLSGVSIFSKDREGILMHGNASFLARFGMKKEQELIGKTDYDLFPKALADQYRRDDHDVMNTATPKLNIIETFINRQGLPDWYRAHKLPIFSRDGKVIGVMGMIKSHKAKSGFSGGETYERLSPAIEHIRENFRANVPIQELADVTGLSLRQFGRSFKEFYGLTPQSFIIKTRVQAACEKLRDKKIEIANLAVELGFYDQSSFTQHFRKHVGVTPRKYREQEGLS